MKERILTFLLLHWHEIAWAFVLSGGLWLVYAWLVLTEVHTHASRMFDEVYEERERER